MKAKYLFGLFIVNLLDYTVHIKIKYLFRDMSEEDKTQKPIWRQLNIENKEYRKQGSYSLRSRQQKSLEIIINKNMYPISKAASENLKQIFQGFDDIEPIEKIKEEIKNEGCSVKNMIRSDFKFEEDQENSRGREQNNSSIMYAEEMQEPESEDNPMLLSLATGLSNQGAFKNRWKLVLSEIERVKVLQKDAVQTLNLERERYNVFIEEIYNKFQFLVNILNEKQQKRIKNFEIEKSEEVLDYEIELKKYERLVDRLRQEKEQIQNKYSGVICELERKISKLQNQNDGLNEQLFSAEQRVAQIDLQVQNKADKMMKKREKQIKKENVRQIQKLQEEIQRLSEKLLNYQSSQIDRKEQDLKRREMEIEEQFEEVAKQHTQIQQRNKLKEAELQQLQKRLYKKMQELDVRENQMYNRSEVRKVNGLSRNKNVERVYGQRVKVNKTFEKVNTQSNYESPQTSRSQKSRNDRSRTKYGQGRNVGNNKLQSLNNKLQKLQKEIRNEIYQAK